MPKGIVANHSSAGSFAIQYCGDPMNACILPSEAASKQSNAGMIWPPRNTSIRNRPPLISSITVARFWVVRCHRSIVATKAVDIRQCTFGWAMTLGASMMVPTAAAAIVLPDLARNLRRSLL
jgi:hypothetical protein